jgi:ferredoxin
MSRAEIDAYRKYQAEMYTFEPNEQCTACGLEAENYHYSCQGHQNCLTECPKCGGELREIVSPPILGDATSASQMSEEERYS